jgi:peroxiredoxin
MINISADWKYYHDELAKGGINMVSVNDELVDKIWTSSQGRPNQPSTPINVLPLQFSGNVFSCRI